ncbi:sugar ABC transporter ATP-binding protein [Caballeronia sp. LjRoot34]|uniref:sugar ABC transporter ATP-binding protein n=1 Tax=Caballeronia sp. LjRoot34 TaxID=3342325 RepID=UPI003ED16148
MSKVEPLLRMRNLTKTFGATRALDSVSVEFQPGEIHCLLGENGAGKSTLGKIVGGLYRPDEGEVQLAGETVVFSSPREARSAGIAMVYQELSLAPDLSVRANLWLGVEGARFPFSLTSPRRESQRASRTMAMLGLAEIDVERRVHDFPMAIQQLIEIGKALMFQPQVIIFDEPTAMLGAVEKEKFFEVLRGLRDTGIAAVLVTHHVDDVMAVGDKVTIMRNGRIVDSFPMTPEIDPDAIVTRLTGKRQLKHINEASGHVVREPMLVMEGLPTIEGPRALTIEKGEIVGLYGVVGCGAETLIRNIVGLEQSLPSGGVRFRLEDRQYRPKHLRHALRSGVSYLAAGRAANGILPDRSISDNLLLTQLGSLSRFGFVRPTLERSRCGELIDECQVKLRHPSDRMTSLSGGNQQKVLVARAMASAKKLLVLEEPTAGVDLGAKKAIHERIREVAESGVSVLVLSSDLPENISLCNKVISMFKGKVAGIYQDPTERDQGAIISDVLGQHASPSKLSGLQCH